MSANIATLTNDDLDRIAIESDSREGERLLAAIRAFLSRFVSYPSEHALNAHALWIIHAHLMERWDSTPRLAFLSPEPASGKTRALEITELLVPNPLMAVNVSPSYLFRKVGDSAGVTILYDEIDTVFGPKAKKDNEEIRGLLNAGHRRGAVAGRCVVRGKEILTEDLPAYAAVALAGLGWLPDTILSRSIVIRMQRRAPHETVEPYRRRVHSPEGDRIRQQIAMWARGVTFDGWPELPPEIQDRTADVWEPLISIADAVGGEWPSLARVTAVTLVTAHRETEASLGIRLLTDLKSIFGEVPHLSTKSIIASLVGTEESPWGDLRGKPIDERGLANRLRNYSIKSTTVRNGETVIKGYRAIDFYDAWTRYVSAPVPPPSVTSVTPVTEPINPDDWTFNLGDGEESAV